MKTDAVKYTDVNKSILKMCYQAEKLIVIMLKKKKTRARGRICAMLRRSCLKELFIFIFLLTFNH